MTYISWYIFTAFFEIAAVGKAFLTGLEVFEILDDLTSLLPVDLVIMR